MKPKQKKSSVNGNLQNSHNTNSPCEITKHKIKEFLSNNYNNIPKRNNKVVSIEEVFVNLFGGNNG